MTLFLDACVIVYWIEAPDPFHARLTASLRALRQRHPDATFAASRLSVLECLVKPLREGDGKLLATYQAFFEAGQLTLVELGPEVVARAAALRARQELRTPDALQAASALHLPGEVLFLTNDRGFSRVPGLRVEIPVEA